LSNRPARYRAPRASLELLKTTGENEIPSLVGEDPIPDRPLMVHQFSNPGSFVTFGGHHPDQEIVCFLFLHSG
jgi:hypothetical protein